MSVIAVNRRFDTDQALVNAVDSVVQLAGHRDQVLRYLIQLGVELIAKPADDGDQHPKQGGDQGCGNGKERGFGHGDYLILRRASSHRA